MQSWGCESIGQEKSISLCQNYELVRSPGSCQGDQGVHPKRFHRPQAKGRLGLSEAGRGKKDPALKSQRECGPATALILIIKVPEGVWPCYCLDLKRLTSIAGWICFCCFKPPSLWYLVTAATGKTPAQHSSKLVKVIKNRESQRNHHSQKELKEI